MAKSRNSRISRNSEANGECLLGTGKRKMDHEQMTLYTLL